MTEGASGRSFASLLLLRETRRTLRGTPGRLLFGSVSIAYLFISLLAGRMLVLGRTGQTSTTFAIFASGYPSWNYPELAIIAPNGILVLPYLSAVTMALVSVGVGLGMSASVVLAFHLVRSRRRGGGVSGLLSGVEGLSPAMIAALTLGACCSTTAASTAGIGLAAQASGTTLDNLLANTWFLNLLQVFVLGLALLAQEQLIRVYGTVLGVTPPGKERRAVLPRWSVRLLLSGLARVALLFAGAIGALGIFVAWTLVNPVSSGPVAWGFWLLAYELVAIFAIAAALAPVGVSELLRSATNRSRARALRGALFASGLLLLLGVPAPFAGGATHGWLNELLGALGAPASWGAIHPSEALGLALYLRWAFAYLLLGGFAVATAVAPGHVLVPLAASQAPPSSTTADASGALSRESPPASSIGTAGLSSLPAAATNTGGRGGVLAGGDGVPGEAPTL
jgi:hypothetical protein